MNGVNAYTAPSSLTNRDGEMLCPPTDAWPAGPITGSGPAFA
jgi:hypothetical protein